ncbi:MAG: hypothetical protein ACLU99_04155 [Alphaproteobacteria bacterium]
MRQSICRFYILRPRKVRPLGCCPWVNAVPDILTASAHRGNVKVIVFLIFHYILIKSDLIRLMI